MISVQGNKDDEDKITSNGDNSSTSGTASSSGRSSNFGLDGCGQFTGDDPETPAGTKLGRIQFSVAYNFATSTLSIKIFRAVNLQAKDLNGTSDPYVKVLLLPDRSTKLTTNVRRKNLNPKWNEVFDFEGTGRELQLYFGSAHMWRRCII